MPKGTIDVSTESVLKAASSTVKLANLVGGVGATAWIITPAAIGALTGTLTKKLSAGAGFMSGAMIGVAGVAIHVIRGFYNLGKHPDTPDRTSKVLHDNIILQARILEAEEAAQGASEKKDIPMTHVQRVASNEISNRAR